MERNKATFCRRVEPFNDVYVNVDLYDVVRPQRGEVLPRELEPVARWLREDKVTLRVISPLHFLTAEAIAQVQDQAFCAQLCSGDNGTAAHWSLIALARAYLEACGKIVCASGRCAYAGGYADACVPGEGYFVECGTLNPGKVQSAMTADGSLLVLPYTLGVERDVALLESISRRPPLLVLSAEQERNRPWLVQFAFEFRPIDGKPRREHRATLFDDNATEGL